MWWVLEKKKKRKKKKIKIKEGMIEIKRKTLGLIEIIWLRKIGFKMKINVEIANEVAEILLVTYVFGF